MFSRSPLECRALVSPKLEDVRYRLEDLFWRNGLPRYLLSDNGPPFASRGIGRLSRLGVWLARLGIEQIFIESASIETLKEEAAAPPRASIRAQQAAFDRFRRSYNEERPHQTLGWKTPMEVFNQRSEAPAA